MAIVELKGKLNGEREECKGKGDGSKGSRVMKGRYKKSIASEFHDVLKALLSSFKCQALFGLS